MKRDYDLLITNLITNELEVIHDFSKYVYSLGNDESFIGLLFYANLKPYIDKQIPYKLEFDYKSSLGKSFIER